MTALIPYAPQWITTDIRADDWTRHYALWLSEFRSSHTREAYHRAWCDFLLFTQGRGGQNPPLHFGSVESQHVRLWKIGLQKQYEPTTVNQRLSAISSFYRYICENAAYLRDDNPVDDVKQITINPYGKAHLLEAGQDIALLQSIDTDTLEGQRDYLILLLYLTTAVRLRELANATTDNFRRQGSFTYFEYVGKGGGAFRRQLPPSVARFLWGYVTTTQPENDAPLFCMKPHQIQYMVKRRCNLAFGEGHGITVHSLRHTAAMNAAEHGTIMDVRSLLGHASTRVTSIYLDHVTSKQGDRLASELAERYTE